MKKKIIGLSGVFIALVLVIVLTIPLMVSMIVTVLFGGNEDNTSEAADYYDGMYVSLLLSDAVENYRPKVLTQAKEKGMEAYIELFLAVMQQESGGNGNDVFQASESKGLPPNTLSADESIKQGVAYLSAMIRKAGCTSPTDIAHIKLALQGYNFGGGYIDFAIKKDGKWTQNNTFAYAKKQSKGKRNTGKRVEQLGPWHYGDQYYTQHVLRYYSTNNTGNTGNAQDPKKVAVNDRLKWLFPLKIPTREQDMKPYLTQIKVPIYTKKGKKSEMTLIVHRELRNEIYGAFVEMQKMKFPIDPTCTAGYSWRMMASNSASISHHSYGCVVDINWTHNGATYTAWPYKPGKDKLSVTNKVVNIWKKHGFYWGGDWSQAYFDPMHFTYTNH